MAMLAVLAIASVVYAGDFGVQIQVDLPLDPAGVQAFVVNPIGYSTSNLDTVTIAAFVESGRIGLRFDLRSATEVQVGGYYILNRWNLILAEHESNIGLYAGYNWNGEGAYLRLRGKLLLYGSF